jgi:hypothetical protein
MLPCWHHRRCDDRIRTNAPAACNHTDCNHSSPSRPDAAYTSDSNCPGLPGTNARTSRTRSISRSDAGYTGNSNRRHTPGTNRRACRSCTRRRSPHVPGTNRPHSRRLSRALQRRSLHRLDRPRL